MTQLNISLTDDAGQFVAEQVSGGRFTSPSEFVQSLIEQARIRAAQERLVAMIEEGENSGPGTEYSEEEWAAKLNLLRAQVPREPAA